MASEGPDVLFENHSVKEIQEIEKKLRNDIERKKEELRQMVGERYRDLMEAADTISEMKDIAGNVTKCVKSIESRCVTLQNSNLHRSIFHTIQDRVDQKKKTNEPLYVIASQLKILMDSPTKMWALVEEKDFVGSVSLYLLAGHAHSLLALSPLHRNVLSRLPLVHRQWHTIGQFKDILLQNSEMILESQDAEAEDVVGPLCCQCLLTNASLEQAFLGILNTRKNVIKSIFQPEKSAKSQVLEFSNIVQMTIKIVYLLFYPQRETPADGPETNLLYKCMKKLISPNEPGPVLLLDVKSSDVFKFLPPEITDFRPKLSFPLEECSTEFLQSHCNEWLDNIKIDFEAELREILSFVTCVNHLALVREALFQSLVGIKQWEKICCDLLNRNFSIWDFFFKDCFLQRAKDISEKLLKEACEYFQKDFEGALNEIGSVPTSPVLKYEKNINVYVWSESASDLADDVAWHPRHRRSFWDSGELSMKSMGFTPKVQSICKNFDDRIRETWRDMLSFCFWQEEVSYDREGALQSFLAEISAEGEVVCQHMAQLAEKYLTDSISFLQRTLSSMESEQDLPEKSSQILFLGHLCVGLAHLCPHINVALSGEKPSTSAYRSKKSTSHALVPTTMKENEAWKSLKKQLLETSADAFKTWSKEEIQDLVSTVDFELETGIAEGLLKILLQWDQIEIQEESERGDAVKSVLKLPQHISTPLSNALFAFCCKLNSIGGFTINSDVRSDISRHLLSELLAVYGAKVSSGMEEENARLLQVQSLQLLFDVQFLTRLLAPKNADEGLLQLSQKIVEEAISHVDPFDMDVFATPLQQNIRKALQKSLSLFGLLTSPDQVSYLSSMKAPPVSSQMDHNVMLTCSSGPRFPLLPLPFQAQEQLPQKELEINKGMPAKPHNSNPNLLTACDTPASEPLRTTASFYEKVTAMSSSWFGN